MSKKQIIQELDNQQIKSDIPSFNVGDTVRVHIRIIEGDKERTQVFAGTVIARKGTGLGETFSVHRVAYGEGMERVFPLHSPRIAKIEVMKEGDVRRSKLYYLRGTSGKKAKVKSKIGSRKKAIEKNGEKAPVKEEVEEVVALDNENTKEVTGSKNEQATAAVEPKGENKPEKADA